MSANSSAATTDVDTPAVDAVLKAFTSPARRPLSPVEQTLLDQAKRHAIAHEGMALAAWTWGADTNPRVLLIHGWESRASHWAAFVPALVAAGFHVCAFDSPAHGESPGEQTDVVAIGRVIGSVAAQLGPIDAVIGHSGGSASGLYAFSHGLQVQASVHLSGPSSLVRVLEHWARAAQLPAELRPVFRARFEQFLGQSASVMDLAQLQNGLRHPGLLLHDPADAEVPYSESLALQEAWPQATLQPVSGLGHRRILKDAGVIEHAIRFLRQQVHPDQFRQS